MVQTVTQPIPLGGQIPAVLLVRRHLDRQLLGDAQPVRLEAGDLLRVVRQQPDRGQAEVGEDLVADPPLALVGGEAEREVGLDGVQPLLLQLVGLELCEQADAAALLRHVEEHAAALVGDRVQRRVELLAAVAAQRVEDVAGQAFGVDADEHVVGAVDVASDERDVMLPGQRLAEADRLDSGTK